MDKKIKENKVLQRKKLSTTLINKRFFILGYQIQFDKIQEYEDKLIEFYKNLGNIRTQALLIGYEKILADIENPKAKNDIASLDIVNETLSQTKISQNLLTDILYLLIKDEILSSGGEFKLEYVEKIVNGKLKLYTF